MLIVQRDPTDTDLAALLDAAFAELVAKYGSEGRSTVRADATYLVAVDGRLAVGCGAVQPVEGTTGELKRMYVAPAHRGRGIARSLLKALEERAVELGYDRLRLATGVRQPEAIALYESSGYVRTAPYGKYLDEPLTLCYIKTRLS
ncbi:GNAT family N-acetyltransferase [Nonomuraea zeae]|uniref:GNAT family N-acetyltransferase n=1 Tax=Nonomuraea zeae TaxID=1642303 RepID=A0A5S4H240_9ACTN|nr:GNAT family N-acetyltransferase [Nonomuraea zeae]TMR38761.1 GNAT family N-acetyltransferase [Nonomuraea zeae]